MSLLDLLQSEECWNMFYEYKSSLACPKDFTRELACFIGRKAWLPVCDAISRRDPFPLPRRSVISKMGSDKKRVVYIYPRDENMVLKLLTWLLLRRYDGLFAPNLYSFRPGTSAKDAVRRLMRVRGIEKMYAYKADIHNYFNSVPVERLIPLLQASLTDDPALLAFLTGLLEEPCVMDGGQAVAEDKGIMAGTPLSAFYANLYLNRLDRLFAERGLIYARYSDDVIVFGADMDEVRAHAGTIRAFLCEAGLEINPDKEAFFSPGEGWTFLGFSFRDGVADIAPATLIKLKQKMRRKARALARWRDRNGISGEKAARAFIRIFNRKLFENAGDNELSWSRWFFSVINTTESLHEIDLYAQDCLRFLISGRHTKARYNVRYDELKDLGYRSLVNAYYSFSEEEGAAAAARGTGCSTAPAGLP